MGAAIAGGGPTRPTSDLRLGLTLCQPPHPHERQLHPRELDQDGRENFINGLNDFAVTGDPVHRMPSRSSSAPRHRTFEYAPVTSSALVLAYKIFDQDHGRVRPGAQVTDLQADPAARGRRSSPARSRTGDVDGTSRPSTRGERLPADDPAAGTRRPLDANLEFTSWLTATARHGRCRNGWPGPSYNYPLNYLTQNAAIVGGDVAGRRDRRSRPRSTTATTTSRRLHRVHRLRARPPTTACPRPRSRTRQASTSSATPPPSTRRCRTRPRTPTA